MSCDNCKSHATDLTEETKAVKRASEITQVYDRQNRRLWIAIMALAASMVIISGCMIWAVTNAQRVANEAMWQALNTVAEMEVISETTTTTTEVYQDTGEGGGNNVYLDGDSTTYNEGGGS